MRPSLYSERVVREYFDQGYWDSGTYSVTWSDNASTCPARPAFIDRNGAVTWAEANRLANEIATGLIALDLPKDAIVLLKGPNSAESYIFRMACNRAGLIVTLLPLSSTQADLHRAIDILRAEVVALPPDDVGQEGSNPLGSGTPVRIVISLSSLRQRGRMPCDRIVDLDKLLEIGGGASPPPSRDLVATELDTIRLTTGSTGMPRFVETPVLARRFIGRHQADRIGMRDGVRGAALLDPASGMSAVPFYSIPLMRGTIVMLEKFDPWDALRLIDEHGINTVGLVPTVLVKMADHPAVRDSDWTSLETIVCSGATLSPEQFTRAEDAFRCKVLNSYGMAEASIAMASITDSSHHRQLTSGLPYEGLEVDVRGDFGANCARGETGRIRVRGPSVHSGYIRAEPEDAFLDSDGWLETGDLGYIDADGYVVLQGRSKDVIIRGGYNILPKEIEEVLLGQDDISEAVCIPVRDRVYGERVCACLVPRSGSATITLLKVQTMMEEAGIAKPKWPEHAEVFERFPLISGQKVDKAALRSIVEERLLNKSRTAKQESLRGHT